MTSPGHLATPTRNLVIVGPTASGKSAVAMSLAERHLSSGHLVELVSGDSMQVYRGMDIGTAKPTAAEQHRVRHHLIDVVDPGMEYSVAEFISGASAALADVESRGGVGIVVGGTALYIQSLIDGLEIPGQFPNIRHELELHDDTAELHERLTHLDPVAAGRMEPTNRRRVIRALEVTIGSGHPFSSYGSGLDSYPPTPFVVAGIDVDRTVLTERIRNRFVQQMSDGFLDEVVALDGNAAVPSRTAAQALGYAELRAHLRGELSLDEAIELAVTRTRQFAVRQIRWFRRDPRITFFQQNGNVEDLTAQIDELWLRS